ncbi:IS5 family transposase [Streptomyces phaeoluteigriseus]|uniref:IS5 family transposase n=1 Tax=Streptomyces phaeoluteigriseus TaxID=114686 RepID=A0A1V6MHH9_9ACTN|nr:IS5 family transposase [Streptomyces phaeoluteigriseus]OQD51921.1 IS5 family transposase [Streptomyces phaeoluteigriseus]
MPVVPESILAPIRQEFLALLPEREDRHPLGCHRPRIPDAVVFDRLVLVLVSGMGYERVADAACSATTLRRRRDEWITAGVVDWLVLAVLAAYDKMVGLELEHLSADGCITKAPSGGACAGRSPVDRGKQGLKRSQLADGYGIPVVTVPAGANIRDHTLLPETLDEFTALTERLDHAPDNPALSLDAGYDYNPVRVDLAGRGITGKIAQRGVQTPIQADGRWVVERTNSWMNNFGKLRRCTERRRVCVEFYLHLATIVITVRSLIRRAWYTHRWPTRPRTPRIR